MAIGYALVFDCSQKLAVAPNPQVEVWWIDSLMDVCSMQRVKVNLPIDIFGLKCSQNAVAGIDSEISGPDLGIS